MATTLRVTVVPLLLAPLPALVVTLLEYLFTARSPSPFFGAILATVAGICYLAELVLVFPLFLIWPSLRVPSLLLAAVWGLTVAWCVIVVIRGPSALNLSLTGIASLSTAGVGSGLFYAVLARHFAVEVGSRPPDV